MFVERERQLILLKLGPTICYGDLARVACKLNTSRARCAYRYCKSFDLDFHPLCEKEVTVSMPPSSLQNQKLYKRQC
jgi:hypothetical protein